MLKPNLIPRLNYDNSLADLIHSVFSFLKKQEYPLGKIYSIFNSKKIFFTNYARTGLRLILDSLDLPQNAKIGIQVYTCPTVFQAIKKAGCRPCFIDINDDYTLDINDLKQKANDIDALIVTHTFGIPADFGEIKKIVSFIPIIEDCAHSFLSIYKGIPTGKLGDAAIFSFGHAKFPSIGKGGVVLINSNKIFSRFKENFNKLPSNSLWAEISNILGNYLKTVAHRRPFYGLFSYTIGKKLDKKFDFSGKFSFKEARVLRSSLTLFFKKSASFFKYREKQRSNAKYIKNNLAVHYDFIDDSEIRELNFFLIPLRSDKRDLIINTCYKYGIEIGKHFADSLRCAHDFGYKEGDCRNAEKIATEIFTIPCHYNSGEKYLFRIVKYIKSLAEEL